jgi:hypothetical protein
MQDVSNFMEKRLAKLPRFAPANANSLCLKIGVSEAATSVHGLLKVFDANPPAFDTVFVQQRLAFSLNFLISQTGHRQIPIPLG